MEEKDGVQEKINRNCMAEELKLAIQNKKIIDVIIRLDAYPDVHFKLGNNAMKSFPDQTELQKYLDVVPEDELKLIEPLITVKFNRDKIDLEYYYSFSEIKKLQGICQSLSHPHFFICNGPTYSRFR